MQNEQAGLPYLRQLLGEIRGELFLQGRRRRVADAENLETGLRITVVRKLVSAINEVEELAKRASGKRIRKGGGGVSPKIRWYQLMGYLAQVLDGVLKNSDMERIESKMEEMENMVDDLQRTTQIRA